MWAMELFTLRLAAARVVVAPQVPETRTSKLTVGHRSEQATLLVTICSSDLVALGAGRDGSIVTEGLSDSILRETTLAENSGFVLEDFEGGEG